MLRYDRICQAEHRLHNLSYQYYFSYRFCSVKYCAGGDCTFGIVKTSDRIPQFCSDINCDILDCLFLHNWTNSDMANKWNEARLFSDRYKVPNNKRLCRPDTFQQKYKLQKVWTTGTSVDNTNNNARTVSQIFDLTALTLFTTVPSDIASYPLTTSFKMTPQKSGTSFDDTKYMEFRLSSSISGVNVNVSLTAVADTRISTFEGIVLIYSIGNVNTDKAAKSWNMLMFIDAWNDPNQYNMITTAPIFGPSFSTKCFYGYSKITYKGDKNPDWQFAFTSTYSNFYYVDYVDNNNDFNPAGCFFCFGNGSSCAENQVYIDNITLVCFTPSTCPLPVFALWTQVGFCPNCTQLICQNCTATNRSNCITCGTNSTLVNGSCVCNSDSWPVNTAISTSTLGQWNGVSSSLTECRYNCTAQIDGCVFDKCTTATFCTQCLVGFYLNVTTSTTSQNCINCSVIANCLQCTNGTACTLCAAGFYLNAGACTQCSTAVTNCTLCTSATGCTACAPGYDLISGTSCKCNPVTNGMANCSTCTLTTACTQCVNTTFFISTATDSMCHPCIEFETTCITCSAYQFCTSCLVGFYVNVTGSTTFQNCVNCSTTITNCLECTSGTACTLCTTGFYINAGSCTECRSVTTNCSTCTSGTTCTSCDPGYANISASVCQCSPLINSMANCVLCTFPTACTQCVNTTFFISTATDSMCHSCREFDPNCITCTADQVCTSCDPGYTVVTVGAASLCQACWVLFPNCTLCSSPSACDVCNYTYGLTTTGSCQICSTLHQTGCQACTDFTGCALCVNQTHLMNGICYPCNVIYKCDTCFVNTVPEIECLTCLNGYYVALSKLTGKTECKLCMHFTSYCETCTNVACLTCVYPYLPGPDGLCSKCEPGFYYVSGICTNIAGCIRAAYFPNGTTTCLACAPQLFFVFDSKLQKCVCAQGYQDFNQVGLLPQCFSVCGDGIIISQFEECDDKNTFNKDGCDQTCKREPGFDCGFSQPSKCILELNVVSFVFNYAFRVLGENKGILSFTILPGHPGLQRWDWSKTIKLNFPSTAVDKTRLLYSYTSETGQLLITVPYMEQLQETFLQTELSLDPTTIKSTTPTLSLVSKLNGINAQLIFEQQQDLDTHKNMNLISLILTVILLLLFYLGSYVHKMIGLETIQVIQAIYFVRMVAPSSSSSLLSSINTIQYSTAGYHNSEFIYGDTTEIQNQLNQCTAKEFTAINLQKFFLLNANFSLIPILLALIAFGVTLVRKYRSRNVFFETKDQELKDDYTRLQRSSQWVYDHFVFPYIMMFNLLSFFQSVELMSDPSEINSSTLNQIETQSFIFHAFIVLCTSGIYCYEVSNSFQEFSKYRMTENERVRIPKSEIEKLQHDENNTDRPNYHPAYVLCHLIYYLVLSILMIISVLIPDFTNSLELTMGVAIFYFLLICIWKPYHEAAGVHNHCLKFYYGTFVIFLVICYLFVKLPKLSGSLYTALMYVIMTLIGVIIVAGFARIIIELRFRRALQNDNSLMRWDSESHQKKRKSSSEQEQLLKQMNKPKISKRQRLIKNNSYSLDQQLFQMNKNINLKLTPEEKDISYPENKSYLMNKVREDIHNKKINMIMEKYGPNTFEFEGLNRKLSEKFEQQIDSIFNDKETDVTHHMQNFTQQLLESPKKCSPKKIKENSQLQSFKQKLRAEWVYMHEE